MDGFTLDSNTVKDCAEHPAAARVGENRGAGHQNQNKDFQKAMLQPQFSEGMFSDRCDSAYGSECLSSPNARFPSADVSDQFQGLRIDPQRQRPECEARLSGHSQSPDYESSERTVERPQKRSAETIDDDVVLTSDAYDQDEEGDTPLAQAIIYEKPDIALKFIRYTTDSSFFNIRNCLGQTALMLTVLTGQDQVCRALVVAGASVDIQDQEGNTALHLACRFKNIKCVQSLTSAIHRAEIKSTMSVRNHREPQNLHLQLGLKNYEGLTCVHLATFQGNLSLLQYMVALGANINEPDGKSGRTALHYAVEMNAFNLVQALVSSLNADVDAVTFDMCTPLHLAAGRGHVDIAYMLHGARADTQVPNYEGQFAFELTDNKELQELLMPLQHIGSGDFY